MDCVHVEGVQERGDQTNQRCRSSQMRFGYLDRFLVASQATKRHLMPESELCGWKKTNHASCTFEPSCPKVFTVSSVLVLPVPPFVADWFGPALDWRPPKMWPCILLRRRRYQARVHVVPFWRRRVGSERGTGRVDMTPFRALRPRIYGSTGNDPSPSRKQIPLCRCDLSEW